MKCSVAENSDPPVFKNSGDELHFRYETSVKKNRPESGMILQEEIFLQTVVFLNFD